MSLNGGEPGEAKATGAFACKACGTHWPFRFGVRADWMARSRSCWRVAIAGREVAERLGIKSIAFPALSTAMYRLLRELGGANRRRCSSLFRGPLRVDILGLFGRRYASDLRAAPIACGKRLADSSPM